MMTRKYKFALFILLPIVIFLAVIQFVSLGNVAVLNPKGWIAEKEYNLLITATLLMLIIVIPVFIMTLVITWRYRAGNKTAKYRPDWDYNFWAECLWWGFPVLIVAALSWIAWTSTHELDPYKPLESHKKPITIQVVALQWKWLFIYPEQKIATINYIQFPEKTPLNFEITSDAPMNSFWIPELGGQIYAMAGMKTKLHLIANQVGSFRGCSANISGEGFADMVFIAKATSDEEFEKWVGEVRHSQEGLNQDAYNKLMKESTNNPPRTFALKDEKLFDRMIMKYMLPMKKEDE